MKLHLIATVLLAVAAPDVVSAKKLRGPEVAPAECPDDQIPCDISSNADCRSSRDKTSRGCKKTWTKGCCTRDCKPDRKGGRVCRIAPPSEDYFGFFGFADVEDYVGDEDSEDFDSGDEESEDMIFSYDGKCYKNSRGGYGRNKQNRSTCCNDEFDDCKDLKRKGRTSENCKRTQDKCMGYRLEALDSEDLISESEDYNGDEDSEEFDGEDLAAENFADSEDDVDFDSEDEDSEDMIFNYRGRCTRTNRNWCCDDEFFKCKDDKRDGFWTPNCARQKQQCYNNLFLAVEVA